MRGAKDTAFGFGLRTLLNTRLDAFGEITDLSLDTAHRRAQLRLALRGEGAPIDLDGTMPSIRRMGAIG